MLGVVTRHRLTALPVWWQCMRWLSTRAVPGHSAGPICMLLWLACCCVAEAAATQWCPQPGVRVSSNNLLTIMLLIGRTRTAAGSNSRNVS